MVLAHTRTGLDCHRAQQLFKVELEFIVLLHKKQICEPACALKDSLNYLWVQLVGQVDGWMKCHPELDTKSQRCRSAICADIALEQTGYPMIEHCSQL